MPRQFEFHAYQGDEDGRLTEKPDCFMKAFEEKAQAKAHAGRLAKRINGPVDLATAGPRPWHLRYLTTAIPSEYHASGYRLERLS